MTRVVVSVGEPSGDAHAGQVVRELLRRRSELEVEAVAGPQVAAAGATPIARAERLAAVGLVEAAGALPRHAALLRRLERSFARGRYDLAILVDYPGFHLRVAAAAAAHGVPVLYYIAPQLWAWGAWRMGALRRRTRCLAVVLPFEEGFFAARGIAARFVGHPLLDRPPAPSRAAARRHLGLTDGRPTLALFPASRPAELHRLWPPFRDAAQVLRNLVPDLAVIVAGLPDGRYPGGEEFTLVRGDSPTVFAAADAALCKSGTATIEAALADVPMVIGYRLHPVTAALARRLSRVERIGLVNLVAGRAVVPELLQEAAQPLALARAVLPLLERDGAAARRQREAFAAVRAALGQPGAAGRVAGLALELAA